VICFLPILAVHRSSAKNKQQKLFLVIVKIICNVFRESPTNATGAEKSAAGMRR
jgi:hypothetical protein